jgi:two-component system, NtrC family, response regulator GlrR
MSERRARKGGNNDKTQIARIPTAPGESEGADSKPGNETIGFGPPRARIDPSVQRFKISVVTGPGAGTVWESTTDRCQIGSHPLNDLILEDATVSRFHCEVTIGPDGARLHDLDSRNGTLLDGVQIREAFPKDGSTVRLGRATLRFQLSKENNTLDVSPRASFSTLVGSSVASRASFALMERAASTNATVLLEGETGTGKSRAAQAIHQLGARKDKPFLVVDCGAIPATLLDSELFGHEKGAFTGAATRRIGAFEEAHGGTVFLDEIGEMPPELQPKLLHVIENREIRRVGSNRHAAVDVRVIAATHRDLRAEVNAGRFRSDLFFRLAVLKITLPPLRQRPEDIPDLVDATLKSLGADPAASALLKSPAFIAELQHATWPGNVRELRNHLERSR